MKKTRMRINWNRFRSVPKKVIILYIMLLCIFLSCLVLLLRPATYWVDKAMNIQLQIEEVHLFKSFSTKSSRRKLTIVSGEQTYYLWYPTDTYHQYSGAVEGALLTGAETSVSAKIVDNSTLWDCITGQHRIVDLRSENSVFYESDAEINKVTVERIVLLLILFPSGLLLAAETGYIGFGYGIIVFRKRK